MDFFVGREEDVEVMKWIPRAISHVTPWATGRCNLRCRYCLRKGTRILMADFTWKPIEEVSEGDYVVGIVFGENYKHAKMVKSKVIAKTHRKDVVYKITTGRGPLYVTDNHAILSNYKRWLSIDPSKTGEVKSYRLKVGHLLKHIVTPSDTYNRFSRDYMLGYLYGVFLGDGSSVEYWYTTDPTKPYLVKYGYKKPVKRVTRFLRLAIKSKDVIERVKQFLSYLGVEYSEGVHTYTYNGKKKSLPKVTVYKKKYIGMIISPEVVDSLEFSRGFVAGMFDAEGTLNRSVLRISNKDLMVLEVIRDMLSKFGFNVTIERNKQGIYSVRLRGGLDEVVRFINTFRPANYERLDRLYSVTPKGSAEVLSIEVFGEDDVYNLQTETGNYVAEGFVVHNCFVYKLYPQQPSSDMPEDVWKALVEFLWRESKDIQKPNIWWFGGEPLVAFSTVIKPCWEYAYNKKYTDFNPYQKKGKAITWGVTTNATLLTQSVPDIEESDIAEWMVKRNFGFLLSIDGTKRTHDMNRVYPDGRGSFDDAWKGVERLMELGAGFQIRWSIAPNQVKYLFEDLEWYIDHGIYSIAPDPVYEVEWDEEALNEFRNQMRLIRENILDWWKEGKKVILKPVRDGLELAFLFENKITRREWRSRCGLAQGGIGVDVNGDIYSCHRFCSSRAVKLGNVKTGWNTRARIEWVRNWIKYPPYSEEGVERCRKCIARGVCFGGCLAVNYDMFGDPHIMPKAYCDLKEILIEVFSPLYFEAKRRGMHDFIKAYMGVRY